jgi:hypothetical protein
MVGTLKKNDWRKWLKDCYQMRKLPEQVQTETCGGESYYFEIIREGQDTLVVDLKKIKGPLGDPLKTWIIKEIALKSEWISPSSKKRRAPDISERLDNIEAKQDDAQREINDLKFRHEEMDDRMRNMSLQGRDWAGWLVIRDEDVPSRTQW